MLYQHKNNIGTILVFNSKRLTLRLNCNVSIMPKSKKINPSAPSYRITRLEFCATHINAKQFPSDMFYVGLANKIYPAVHKVFSAQPGFTTEVSKRMAITLACYVKISLPARECGLHLLHCTRKNTGIASLFTISESKSRFFLTMMNCHRFMLCCFYFGM